MSKEADQHRLDEVLDTIKSNPDQKPGWIARFLNRDNKGVQRDLILLEERGDLLQEDEKGRVGWFGRGK